jgi:hypothetical protein
MTEATAKRNKINFFSEKKWIMAYWFKKTGFGINKMFLQWGKWWEDDFQDISDPRFQEAYEWVEKAIQMTKDEIKQKRHDAADNRPMPQYIKKLAAKKGLYVKKCSTRNHRLKVSGYAIFKKQKDKKAIYGKKFELTAKQVIEYLNKQEDK